MFKFAIRHLAFLRFWRWCSDNAWMFFLWSL